LDFSKSTNEKQVSNLEWPYQPILVRKKYLDRDRSKKLTKKKNKFKNNCGI